MTIKKQTEIERRRDDALRPARSAPPKPKQESEKAETQTEKEKPAK
jgi:hypothetical protein